MVDTLSPYRSPVRLVLHAAEATSPYSAQAISRARKKMMAEIALGGDEVVIDDVAYSRNDAATLLDHITEEAWRTHCIIYTFPGLLQFLEKQTFDNEALRKADAYLYDHRFVSVVSPYFAFSFNALSGSFLKDESFEELQQLLDFQGYILPEHQHEAFQKIRNYLDELSYTLRNLSWEKFIADESILHFVFDEAWQQCMNALPPLFTTLRDEIVTHLIEIVLRFQQKATWYYLHQVLLNLRALETNEFNRHEITRIDEVIYANTKLEGKRGKPKSDGEISSGRIIWWGIWIVLMIVRAATCNDRSSSKYNDYSYSSGPPLESVNYSTDIDSEKEQKNEKMLLQQMHRVLQNNTLATINNESKTGQRAFEFSDDPRTARNDSLMITNNTDFDAVFMYFKDIPGHSMSGMLPKFYSALIKKGETQRVYLLANNGRVYFAFGENWGTLAKPVALNVQYNSGSAISESGVRMLYLDHFFSSGKKPEQNYLLQPLYVESAYTKTDTKKFRYFNKKPRPIQKEETTLLLQSSGEAITIVAEGMLQIKQERTPIKESAKQR